MPPCKHVIPRVAILMHLEDAVDGLHACRDSSCCGASAGLACYMVASTVGYICQEVQR